MVWDMLAGVRYFVPMDLELFANGASYASSPFFI
jgi:hypothetical protein